MTLLTALLFADRAYGLPKKFGRVATMNDNEPDLERLARYVKSRRQHLGLRQDEVGARGGPSTTTLTKVENATPPAPATVTLRKLDRGLGWTAGSARRLLEGGEPETEGDDDSAAVDRAYYQLSHPPQRFQTKASTPEGARAAAVLWVEILESFDLAVRAVDMGATVGSARSFLQAAFGLTMSSGMAGAMDDPTLTEEAIRRFSSAMQKIEAIAAQSTDVEDEDEGEHHDHQPDTEDSPATQPRAPRQADQDQKTRPAPVIKTRTVKPTDLSERRSRREAGSSAREESPEDAIAARTRDPRFAPDDPAGYYGTNDIGEENQDARGWGEESQETTDE